MKIHPYIVLYAALLGFVPMVLAKQADPVPIGIVKYQNLDVPIYNAKDMRPTRQDRPVYPSEERSKGIGGGAMILAVVDEEGNVLEAAINEVNGGGAFGKAAQACVLKWRYKPLKKEGKPIRFMVNIPIVFQIQ